MLRGVYRVSNNGLRRLLERGRRGEGMCVETGGRVHFSQSQLEPSTSSHDGNDEGVRITEACVSRLKRVGGEGECLRVEVDGGGCSGFEYKFFLDKQVRQDDRIFEKEGVKVVVDELSLSYMKGATVDYQEELIRSSFRVTNNPLAEKGCSCGASFALKMD